MFYSEVSIREVPTWDQPTFSLIASVEQNFEQNQPHVTGAIVLNLQGQMRKPGVPAAMDDESIEPILFNQTGLMRSA